MFKDIRFRCALIASLLVASAYLIWPTYKVYSLSESEKYELGVSVMKELKDEQEKYELKDFDLAYAYESLARSYAALKNKGESKVWYKKAKQAGELISDNKDKEIFNGDLKAGPWFNCLD